MCHAVCVAEALTASTSQAEDDSKRMIEAAKAVIKVADEERPHTLTHGDFNAGNCWKPKAGAATTGFLFADWQIMGINSPT